VVVAAFQAERTLAQAIDSVLAQTHAPLEVVVCDDGSTDGTADIARSYGSAIRLVQRPNGGEAAAKNTAVRAAGGEFVAVLDADDLFAPSRLEALAWLSQRRPDLDVLLTDARLTVNGRVVGRAYHAGWPFECADQPREILRRNFVLGLAAVRRERWLAVGGFDEAVHLTADWDFFIRLIRSGSRAGVVDAPLAEYRLRAGTLSSDRTALVESRIGTLARARARGGLTSDELRTLDDTLAAQRRDLLIRRAKQALLDGSSTRRRQLVAIAGDPGFRPSRRAVAMLAAALPSLAACRLRRIGQGSTEVGTGARLSPGHR
jgi:GT2 family glycosyltransferase